MRKFFICFSVALIVIVLALLVSFRFSPQLYVSVYNKFSEDKVSVKELYVRYFPLSVSVGGLTLDNKHGKKMVSVDKANVTAQLLALIQGKNNFWKAAVVGADVQLEQFPDSSQTPEDEKDSEQSLINVHQILSSLNVFAGDVKIQLDDQSYLQVKRLGTQLNDETLTDYTKAEQGVDLSISFNDPNVADKPLTIQANLASRFEQGRSVLDLDINQIDLTSLLDSSEAEDLSATSAAASEKVVEEAVDWQWLSTIEPFRLNLKVAEVLWSKSTVEDIDLQLNVDQAIEFTNQSTINWLESDDFTFKDRVSLAGNWKPISESSLGADLIGATELSTAGMVIKIAGDVNVNGSAGNNLSVELNAAKLPITTTLDEQTVSLTKQYFPLSVVADIKQEAQSIDVLLENAQFGESDIKGKLSFKEQEAGVSLISADFNSQLLSYKSLDVEQTDETQAKSGIEESAQEKGKADSDEQRVFTSDEIDWSWLDDLALNFNWQVNELAVDETQITDLLIPASVANGVLNVDGLLGKLGGGAFDVKSTLSKIEEGASLEFALNAKEIVLEKLNLLPPEELKSGLTDVVVNLSSSGSSAQDIAKSLNGAVKVNVGDGVIGNNSFELIGSDLILGLLNKLNPFAKKHKTTDLECAIVNLNIENGKVDIDKSLALRTSAVTIVADGHVDLGSEKIKLSLTPKARKGVGVDVSSLVKFIDLGGVLSDPKPVISAAGLLESAAVVGAAVSTGGASLVATSVLEKTVANVDVCKRADEAFN